jgi:hypothetical protein
MEFGNGTGVLSTRRISVHPAGGVMTMVESGRTVIDAIITSFCTVPAGLLMVSVGGVARISTMLRLYASTVGAVSLRSPAFGCDQ